MYKVKILVLLTVVLLIANIGMAAENNRQYMQIYHQQQLERAAREKAQYQANHSSNDSRRGLADLVGGGSDGNLYLENNELTNEEYERFQRENRW